MTANSRESRIQALRPTSVLAWHDHKDLHVRFTCLGTAPDKLEAAEHAPGAKEFFPGGDHVEFVLVTDNGVNVHHFAVDVNNNRWDARNGESSWNASWETSARKFADGYEIDIAINLESLKIELTKDNRFSACFARMAPHGGAGGSREFSSWRGVHPNSIAAFGDVFLNME